MNKEEHFVGLMLFLPLARFLHRGQVFEGCQIAWWEGFNPIILGMEKNELKTSSFSLKM